MNLLPTVEQQAIAANVAAVLEAVDTFAAARGDAGGELARRTWATAAEQGWFVLGLPEDLGGIGYDLTEEALLVREVGRTLLPGPVVPTMLAARVAALAGDERAAALAAGDLRAALLVGPGTLIDGVDADLILAPATGSLHPMSALADIEEVDSVDPGTTVQRVRLATTSSAVTTPGDGAQVRDRARVLVAAMATGIAEATRDRSVVHATQREQFGRPIGTRQAVKHRCADMAVRAEAAWAQTVVAAISVRDHARDASLQAVVATHVAIDAARRNAGANLQNHGGMGFTWEHDSHLFVERARVLDLLVGDARQRLDDVLAAPSHLAT